MWGLTYALSLHCHYLSLGTTTVPNNKREGGFCLANGTGYSEAGPAGTCASCCKMQSRNLQPDWSSGCTAVPGSKDAQWYLSCLAQEGFWNNTASLCIWAQTASGPCRCVNTVSKAIHAIWGWLFPHWGPRHLQVSDLVTSLWHIIQRTTLIQSIWKMSHRGQTRTMLL